MKFMKMCKKSGFAENFDALNGEGHFCPSYTWTSSVFMMLCEEYQKAATPKERRNRCVKPNPM